MAGDGNFVIRATVVPDTSQVQAKLGKIDIPVTTTGSEKIKELELSIEKLNTKVERLRNSNTSLKTKNKDLEASLKQLQAQTKSLDGSLTKTTTTTKKLGSQMTIAGKSIRGIGGDFVATTMKVGKFYLSTLLIQGFTTAIRTAKEAVVNFDAALTDFKKVSDLSGDALDSYTKKLGDLGTEVARTRTEMVESATQFRKSGYTDEESAKLAQIAELYRNVADAEISSGDAASYVISQMKAFKMETSEAITIIDKTNEVSNNFAVSSTDISTALTKTSATMASYGNTIDQSIAMVVAGTEIMTNQASRVGRGIRSIGANITKLANGAGVLEYTVNGATKSIQLMDETTGDMKNTYTVLNEISESWEDMSNAEQSALAVSLAG